MQKTMVGKIRRLGLAAVLVAGSGLANAAVIKATWDPEYGPAFPGLAFTGEAQFYVPDGCLIGDFTSPTFIADGAACSADDPNGAGISLRSAFVDLYTFTGSPGDYSTTNRTFLQRITYASPAGLYGSTVMPDPLLGVVVQVDADTGLNEVIGASSSDIAPPPGLNIPTIPDPYDAFFLRLGPGPDAPANGTVLDSAVPYQQSSLFACGYVGSDCVIPSGVNTQSNAAPVVFSRVPEPGSLALVLGALAAGWAARRSRRPVDPAAC